MRHLRDLDGQLDRAVGQRLLGDAVALPAGLDLGLFDGVGLQKAVELLLVAPGAAVVVELQAAAGQVADDRIVPAGQLDRQAGGRAAEELDRAVRSGGGSPSRWQAAATAAASRTWV